MALVRKKRSAVLSYFLFIIVIFMQFHMSSAFVQANHREVVLKHKGSSSLSPLPCQIPAFFSEKRKEGCYSLSSVSKVPSQVYTESSIMEGFTQHTDAEFLVEQTVCSSPLYI